jgi:UDP-3-O-[3-hydroxymyristoyl] glucosamine N-acyltransferase
MPLEGKRISLKRVAEILNIQPPRGWEEIFINRVCPPDDVQNPCAVVISEKKHLEGLKKLPTLLVAKKGLLTPEVKEKTHTLEVENPRLALALIMREIYPEEHPNGVSPKATLGKGVKIGKDVYIGDFTYIGNNVTLEDGVKVYPGCYIGDNTTVGEGTVIYPHAVIFPHTVIGKNVKIYPGAVVGREGFGFVNHGGKHIKIPHAGVVVIGDNAEIGANSCVDRALLEQTVVGEDSKIDNLVQVGHNCRLGKGVILVSQVGLSGSVEIGDYAILAGQVGVADHVKIGREVIVTAKSGVAKDLSERKVYGANLPAIEWSRWKRIYTLLLKLPELFQKIKRLSK